jgi:hypothetical protein
VAGVIDAMAAVTQEGLETAGGRQSYRAELERGRDEQYQWPARRRPLMIGVVAIAFLFGGSRLFDCHQMVAGAVHKCLAGPAVVATLVLGMYLCVSNPQFSR